MELLRVATAGDPCPRCGTPLERFAGIEVGHVFFLGTRYSEPMGCTFSVPSVPTGMIGTPAATASRATPVRPR